MAEMIVSIEKQSDGTYIAYNTNINGLSLIGTGNSVSEAKEDFNNSMTEVAETYDKNDIPECLKTAPVFKFDLASLFEYYSMLNVSAFAGYVGINAALMRQYKQGNTYISEKQLQKIEEGIHKLGEEFTNLKLV